MLEIYPHFDRLGPLFVCEPTPMSTRAYGVSANASKGRLRLPFMRFTLLKSSVFVIAK